MLEGFIEGVSWILAVFFTVDVFARYDCIRTRELLASVIIALVAWGAIIFL